MFGTVAVGYYSMTYDGNDAGLVSGPRRLRRRGAATPMQADKWGETDLDAIYRGGNCWLQMTLKEWTATTRAMCWPFGSDLGAVGQCGKLLSSYAKPIILTAEAGSLAAVANGFATLSATLAVVDMDGQELEWLLGNVERDIPITLKLLPYADSSSIVRWFSYT